MFSRMAIHPAQLFFPSGSCQITIANLKNINVNTMAHQGSSLEPEPRPPYPLPSPMPPATARVRWFGQGRMTAGNPPEELGLDQTGGRAILWAGKGQP
jgi:hypothetical protein